MSKPLRSKSHPGGIVKQGFVSKRAVSAIVFKVWRERFLVLRPQLICWQITSNGEILGSLEITGLSTVRRHAKLERTLEFESHGNILMFQCESEIACAEWMVIIEDQIKAIQQPSNAYASDARVKFYNDYDLKETIGEGKYGEVFIGINKKTQERRAVKIIQRAKLLADGVDLKIVEREVNILLKLRHDNICFVESFYKTDGSVYLVCELCKGGDLFARVFETKGKYTEAKCLIIMKRLCSAIAFCHEHGVLHRDLKLENVVLENNMDDTSVKLIDFGLARPYEAGEMDSFMTAHVGTHTYQAPEILDKSATGYFDRKCPEKVDIWGLGIVMYCCLTAVHPFWDNNPIIRNGRIMKGHYDVALMSPGGDQNVSMDAQDFLRKCLTVDATRRFSAAELLAHKWLAGV